MIQGHDEQLGAIRVEIVLSFENFKISYQSGH